VRGEQEAIEILRLDLQQEQHADGDVVLVEELAVVERP
jgi:hypothetical protein